MNDAAGDICVRNPIMLSMRGELLELARKSVNDSGYEYKKGKSRSKRFGSASSVKASTPKRPKLDQEFRARRMQQIQEEVKTINTQLSFKERRVEAGAQLKNFKLCDQLTDEISELQRQRRALEMELQCLEKKEKNSNWYQKQKATRKRALSPLSSDSESSVTPLSPRSTILQRMSTPASSPSSSLSHGHHHQRRSVSTPPQFISRQSGSTVDLTRQDSGDTVILSGESEVGDDLLSSPDPSF